MTPLMIAGIVAEIEAYGRSERADALTWKALTAFSGFSQVSLWKKPAIKAAFTAARQARRLDATPNMKAPKTSDERVVALEETISQLRATIRAYDERWAFYEYNTQRLGIDPDELERPLNTLTRETVKSRRLKSLR